MFPCDRGRILPAKLAGARGSPVMWVGLVLLLHATPASASREGEALVTPVLWIVGFTVVTFAALVLGGALLGVLKASRSGESILKGGGRGLLRGLLAFVVVMAVLFAVGTVAGLFWIAFSFLYVYVLNPS